MIRYLCKHAGLLIFRKEVKDYLEQQNRYYLSDTNKATKKGKNYEKTDYLRFDFGCFDFM